MYTASTCFAFSRNKWRILGAMTRNSYGDVPGSAAARSFLRKDNAGKGQKEGVVSTSCPVCCSLKASFSRYSAPKLEVFAGSLLLRSSSWLIPCALALLSAMFIVPGELGLDSLPTPTHACSYRVLLLSPAFWHDTYPLLLFIALFNARGSWLLAHIVL